MISIKVGLVLKITDGYTEKPVDGKALLFFVDNVQKKAVYKEGGFYAFTQLEPGVHELIIRSNEYEDERLTFETGCGIMPVDLKPGKRYIYGQQSTVLSVFNSSSDEVRFFIGRKDPVKEIKIAQSDLKEGAGGIKLFFDDTVKGMSFPRRVLIIDGEKSETIVISELSKDDASPLSFSVSYAHKRGCLLCPVQEYSLMAGETVMIHFPGKKESFIFIPKTKKLMEIAAGTDSVTI